MGLETPKRAFFASEEAGSHALRKRPPAVESNGFKKVLDYSHQHLILNDKGEKLMPKHTIRGGQFHGSVICNSLGNYSSLARHSNSFNHRRSEERRVGKVYRSWK